MSIPPGRHLPTRATSAATTRTTATRGSSRKQSLRGIGRTGGARQIGEPQHMVGARPAGTTRTVGCRRFPALSRQRLTTMCAGLTVLRTFGMVGSGFRPKSCSKSACFGRPRCRSIDPAVFKDAFCFFLVPPPPGGPEGGSGLSFSFRSRGPGVLGRIGGPEVQLGGDPLQAFIEASKVRHRLRGNTV